MRVTVFRPTVGAAAARIAQTGAAIANRWVLAVPWRYDLPRIIQRPTGVYELVHGRLPRGWKTARARFSPCTAFGIPCLVYRDSDAWWGYSVTLRPLGDDHPRPDCPG